MSPNTKPPTRGPAAPAPLESPFDPGPLPPEYLQALRVFAPVAVGDFQTANSYLENGVIRLGNAWTKGEKFTTFEQRSMDSALRSLAETLELVQGMIRAHQQLIDAGEVTP